MAYVPVDAVGLEERAAQLGTRSIKKQAKVAGLRLAIACMDLTTLEGKDTPGRILQLCRKAIAPDPDDASVPSVAAVCVYPTLVEPAAQAVRHSNVRVASVATAFPSGLTALDVKLQEAGEAVRAGAHEIDMVIDRGAFLAGRYGEVAAQIAAVKDACRPALLKVILETGELATYDNVRRASWLAMEAGADFIKTSTGKVEPSATLPVALAMLEAARDFEARTGRAVGVKVAGGVRTAKQALQYLVLVKETRGQAYLDARYFRIGASSLLNDVLMQLAKERSGAYQSEDYFTKD
ncbi:MAG: deoxyribose-phosphate aldolase [Candidatus Eremiobacteraeota bacterium]|nr:deoxyribose-phosphate aldolase [Candidatus Eremiobacteraeota bacterium]